MRLTINSDGSGSVVAKSVDKHAGLLTAKGVNDSGKFILDTVGEASEVQVQDALKQLQGLGFWAMTTEESQATVQGPETTPGYKAVRLLPVDGAGWVFEGVKNGEYHVVDRWSPEYPRNGVVSNREFARLCRYFLQLGNVEVKNLY